MPNSSEDEFTIVEQLNEAQIEQLFSLIQQQWWGGKRSFEDVKLMAQNTSLMIGLVETHSGKLIGYCRVLTDFVFRATVYDVMVDQDFKGQGLGIRLMNTLSNHPRLQQVSFVYLCCEKTLFPFYEKWGFKPYEGRAEWMIRVQREE